MDAEPAVSNSAKMLEAARQQVATALHHEALRASSDPHVPGTRNGTVESNTATLIHADAQGTYPAFLALDKAPWPAPLLELRRQAQIHTSSGLFPSVGRGWVVVDHHFATWSLETGSDVNVYSDEPGVITAVGLVAPPRGLFTSYVHRLVLLATQSTVSIVGLSFADAHNNTMATLIALGYTAQCEAPLTKFVQHDRSARIFAASGDGCLYEIVLQKADGLLHSRLRLINRSIYFGSVPVVKAVGRALSAARQAWLRANGALIDVVVDQSSGSIFTLSDTSVIEMYNIADDGQFSFRCRLHHLPEIRSTAARFFDGGDQTHGGTVPLASIHVASSGPYLLVAVAQNAERFFYSVSSMTMLGSDTLVLQERAALSASGVVRTTCVSGDSFLAVTHTGTSDELLMVASPAVIPNPYSSFRDVLSTASSGAFASSTRIEAVAELNRAGPSRLGEAAGQLHLPPRKFAVLCRHGLTTYIRLRPVDILHALLASPEAVRQAQLPRFSDSFGRDTFCMLLQIAASVSTAPRPPLLSGSGVDARLVSLLSSPPSSDVVRRALEHCRSHSAPTAHPQAAGSLTVAFSPVVQACASLLARAVAPLWNQTLIRTTGTCLIDVATASSVDKALLIVRAALSALKGDVWSDAEFNRSWTVQWERDCATVVNGTASDAAAVQSVRMRALFDTCAFYQEVVKVALLLPTLSSEVRHAALSHAKMAGDLTLNTLVQSIRGARNFTRALVRAAVEFERHNLVPRQDALQDVFATLQGDCPTLFSATDFLEQQSVLTLDNTALVSNTSGALLGDDPTRVVQELKGKALSLWTTGALEGLCQRLVILHRSFDAVSLLVHAAAQLDPSGACLAPYQLRVAQGNGEPLAPVKADGSYLFAQKLRIVEAIVSLLERTWGNRTAFDELLPQQRSGAPSVAKGLWSVEPGDQVLHLLLFDWLLAPRADEAIATFLLMSFVHARSPWLESYLQRNTKSRSFELAVYLHQRKRDYASAVDAYVATANSSLEHYPSEKRLSHRMTALREAQTCAGEGGVTTAVTHRIAVLMEQLGTQEQLLTVMASALRSGQASLSESITVDGTTLSQHAAVEKLTAEFQSQVVSTERTFDVSGLFYVFGGALVQLRILTRNRIADSDLYQAALEGAFQCNDPQTTAQDVLRFYSDQFPLVTFVALLETIAFAASPSGTLSSVDALFEARVAPDHIVAALQDTLCATLAMPTASLIPLNFTATVTPAFALHSLVGAVLRALKGRDQTHSGLRRALAVTAEARDKIYQSHENDPCSREALRSVDAFLAECDRHLDHPSLGIQ